MTNKEKISAGAQLAAMRPSEDKKCPECGTVFTALVCASSTCRKCRDKLRKRANKLIKKIIYLSKIGEYK